MKVEHYADCVLHLRSSLPGRQRWDVEGLRQKPLMAAEIERRLAQEQDVFEVKANPMTGRVLVIFDPAGAIEDVGLLILAAIRGIDAGHPQEQPETQAVAVPAKEHLVDRVMDRLSKFELDHRTKGKGQPGLFDLIKSVETDKKLRWKATGLSLANKSFGLLGSVFMAATMTAALTRGFKFLTVRGIRPGHQVALLGVMYFAAKTTEKLIGYHAKTAWKRYATEIEHNLRLRAFNHLEHLDMAYFDNKNTGQMMSLVYDDALQIRRFLETVPHTALTKGLAVTVVSATFLTLSPSTFLWALAPSPFIFLTSHNYHKKTGEKYGLQGQDEQAIRKRLTNSLSGLTTVKSFTAENYELQQLSQASARLRASTLDAHKTGLQYSELTNYVVMAACGLPMICGGFMVVGGTMSIPTYMLQNFLLPEVILSLEGLDRDADLYQSANAAARRLNELLSCQPQIRNGRQVLTAEAVRGEIRFERVGFGYQPDQAIFDGFNLHIPAHQTVAFVGTTGMGKTTLLKLLLRFYDARDGQILLDGTDIRELNFFDLRTSIGLVSQDVFLFQGTVAENIRYSYPWASHEEVVAAARAAEALDFIQALPQGFDTVVGERGLTLSGGEKQRIAIARAVLKNAPILVMDEATSSVDNETEGAIQRSIDRISKGRTTIIIAHRMSTIRNVDQIFLLDKGRVKEQGTHTELLAQNGAYAALWKLQTGERE